MKFCLSLSLAALLCGVTSGNSASADDARLGGMTLLPGYKHHPLQGIDSIVGEIKKEGGLRIMYEIGAIPKPGAPRFGGSFSDRPKNTPKDQVRWYKEQTVNGQPVHLACKKDGFLLVSFPQKGINFSAKVSSDEELADALLMILTYPGPAGESSTP